MADEYDDDDTSEADDESLAIESQELDLEEEER